MVLFLLPFPFLRRHTAFRGACMHLSPVANYTVVGVRLRKLAGHGFSVLSLGRVFTLLCLSGHSTDFR